MLLGVAACVTASALPASSYVASSALSKGTWVKVKVTDSGIFAITQSDLAKWGFKDITKVKVCGYGGAPVSETLTDSQIDDLPQVPVLVAGGKLFFYAQGPTTWLSNSTLITYKQYQHPYATAGYYLITDRDDMTQNAISSVDAAATATDATMKTFTDRLFHEKELYTATASGTYLMGEDFKYNTTQSFKFSLPDYVEGTDLTVLTAFAAKTIGGSSNKLTFQYNGTNLTSTSSDNIAPVTSSYTAVNVSESAKSFKLSSSDLTYTIGFAYSGTLYTANLDYITVNYTRKLALNGGIVQFRTPKTMAAGATACVSNCASATHLWDVTTANRPFEITATKADNSITFAQSAKGGREYVAFDETANVPSPTFVETVANQNIHAQATPDMIVISPTEYIAQAQRIAAMHEQVDSMRVLVLDQQEVFNEFSSGTPDFMAYRKVAKMFYDRGVDSTGHKMGYLLLFGRGTYDNRQLTSTVKALGYPMLLTWQSANGTDEIYSYSSDDLLSMMADGSGSVPASEKLDIAIGRMPIKSVSEAKDVVDKLVNYVTKTDFGSWKNNVLMIADDENNGVHMIQAESVIKANKDNGGSDFVFNRIYLDSYVAESTGQGRTYPGARKDFFQKLDEGVLLLDYIGHSSGVTWSAEGLLTNTDIGKLYLKHLPLFYTASCEFTRLDAVTPTGGEDIFLNSRGGAIALITTARQVTISDNGVLNRYVGAYMYRRDASGNYLRIGDILRLGKNMYLGDSNKLRYYLVGDPAMRLAYPNYKIKIESINGQALSADNMPSFKARETLVIKGAIYTPKGEKATGFNGTVSPTLYDAEQSVVTHGYGDDGLEYAYQDRSNKLATAKDTVVGGEFSVKLSVPSEITFPSSFGNYSPAMLSMYASTADGHEANGTNEQLYIYGYDDGAVTDTVGPAIKSLVLNGSDFKDGANVNESPMVIASLSDASGINFSSSGIGHQMSLVLDGKTSYSDVSAYYSAETCGEGCAGNIRYPMTDLAEGAHTLKLKVWDTFENSSEQTINFNVVKGLQPELYQVYTTTNPASVEAVFYLKHNRPDALITVTLKVYDLMGRELWSTTQTGKSDMFTSFPITWNLTDGAGRRVPRGIYIYKAGISTDGEQETTTAKKIAVSAE